MSFMSSMIAEPASCFVSAFLRHPAHVFKGGGLKRRYVDIILAGSAVRRRRLAGL